MVRVEERHELAEHFRESVAVFTTSRLYRALCPVVAENEEILDLLRNRRPGQQPSFLLFGAVHYLLLAGVDHRLRDFYASISGDAANDPADAGPVFVEFCLEHRSAIDELIATRLVQSNVVRRAMALRVALAALRTVIDGPVHLVEVGASAGLLLHVDRYRYRLGDRVVGPPDARITVDTEWRGHGPAPDIGEIPPIASRLGIDLYPVRVERLDERRWLRALVWPENRASAELLDAALTHAAAAPVPILAGDAVDVCPVVGRQLPRGEARLVFHAATRMHVPPPRRAAFDEAIDAMGATGPLYHVWQEPTSAPHHGETSDERECIAWHGPDATTPLSLARTDGHLNWMAPLHKPC